MHNYQFFTMIYAYGALKERTALGSMKIWATLYVSQW